MAKSALKTQQSKKKPEVHEPLFHVVKRDTIPWWKAWIIRVSAILVAMIVCGLLALILLKKNPLDMYKAMFDASFGYSHNIWKLLKNMAILLCIALALTPAFRMKFWNIGAEGQVLVGCLATTACMYYFSKEYKFDFGSFSLIINFHDWAIIIFMLVAAVVAGALWGLIPAIFKAKFNTNETLFTLMMNYVATYLTGWVVLLWTGRDSMKELPSGHLPHLFNNQYILVILVVALLTVAMYVYLKYSKHGYEITVVGESNNTARYIGVSVPKVIIRTMIVSGLICGLAGFLIVGGFDHAVNENTVGGQGFTAIMVAWMGKFNPLYMVLTSFLIVFLEQGAEEVAASFNVSDALPNVITGVILFFIIGCEFFLNYKMVFRKKNHAAKQLKAKEEK